MNIKVKRGQILKELRTKKGLKQSDMADFLGITPQAYQRYEYGTSEPNADGYSKLADFYGVSTDYLLGREPPPNPLAGMGIDLTRVDDDAFIKAYRSLPEFAKIILIDAMKKLAEAAAVQQDMTVTRSLGDLEDARAAEAAEKQEGGKFA